VEVCGGERHFLRSVDEALKMSEREDTMSLWAESEGAGRSGSGPSSPRTAAQPEQDPLAGAAGYGTMGGREPS